MLGNSMSITQKPLEPHPIACPYFQSSLLQETVVIFQKKNVVSVTTFDNHCLCAEMVSWEATGGFCSLETGAPAEDTCPPHFQAVGKGEVAGSSQCCVPCL